MPEIACLGQSEMIELLIYFIALIIFYIIAFNVLKAIHIEAAFKKNHIFEIRIAYILFSIIIAHLLAEIVLNFYDWVIIVIQQG